MRAQGVHREGLGKDCQGVQLYCRGIQQERKHKGGFEGVRTTERPHQGLHDKEELEQVWQEGREVRQ